MKVKHILQHVAPIIVMILLPHKKTSVTWLHYTHHSGERRGLADRGRRNL